LTAIFFGIRCHFTGCVVVWRQHGEGA
jgi:hypothetical protein